MRGHEKWTPTRVILKTKSLSLAWGNKGGILPGHSAVLVSGQTTWNATYQDGLYEVTLAKKSPRASLLRGSL